MDRKRDPNGPKMGPQWTPSVTQWPNVHGAPHLLGFFPANMNGKWNLRRTQ